LKSLTSLLLIGLVFLISPAQAAAPIQEEPFPDSCSLEAVVCPDEVKIPSDVEKSIGKASWYDYDLKEFPNYGATHLTAASRDLPRKSRARITNLANGKSVEVVINDYVVNPKVIIDLSQLAFSQIADLRQGIISVKVEKL